MIHDCPWSWRHALRADLDAYHLTPLQALGHAALLQTVGINFLYRASHILSTRHHSLLAQLFKSLIFGLWSADISPRACLGEGLTIAHSSGIVIGGEVIVGKHCEIFSSVVLGGRNRTAPDGRTMPKIGDDVVITTSAAILGPVIVGSGSVIGAHAIILTDVPAGSTIKGVWKRRN